MTKKKNIFISHVHEDDELLPKLKSLINRAGMEVRDGSINSDKPNRARSKPYIQREILTPRIKWASVLMVLITNDTADSWWVNWEIRHAVEEGKRVVGVFAQGATDADIPKELQLCGDVAVVGWQGDRVVDAINGKLTGNWDDPVTGRPREPVWKIKTVNNC